MTDEERNKAINIEDNETDDEATRIVTETLKELQNFKIGTQQKVTVMGEKKTTVDMHSSSKETDNPESEIQIRFGQIKEKNEEIKNQAYSRFIKEKPGNKYRLLSAFDYSSNKLVMSFFKPTVIDPRSIEDYSKIDFEVDADAIHELDEI